MPRPSDAALLRGGASTVQLVLHLGSAHSVHEGDLGPSTMEPDRPDTADRGRAPVWNVSALGRTPGVRLSAARFSLIKIPARQGPGRPKLLLLVGSSGYPLFLTFNPRHVEWLVS